MIVSGKLSRCEWGGVEGTYDVKSLVQRTARYALMVCYLFMQRNHSI